MAGFYEISQYLCAIQALGIVFVYILFAFILFADVDRSTQWLIELLYSFYVLVSNAIVAVRVKEEFEAERIKGIGLLVINEEERKHKLDSEEEESVIGREGTKE